MLAYKFLAAGAVAPFTRRPWPMPDPLAPGAWVVAREGELARYGVHACRTRDLAYWPDEELWLVELAGPLLSTPVQLIAGRARLLRRIEAWDGACAREYAAACAFRARDLAAEALGRVGMGAEASALTACLDLASLQACASAISGDAGGLRGLAAYVAGAAMRARQARFPEASLQAANLGAALVGSPSGAEVERAWQASWLSSRLQLSIVEARSGPGALAV